MRTLDSRSHLNVDQRIAAIALPNGGIVAGWQLRAAGIGRGAVHVRLRDGRLERLTPRAYRVTMIAPTLTPRTRRGLAIVNAGPGLAALARGTAAAQLGLLDRGDGTIHVTADHFVEDVPDYGIVYHRARDLAPGCIIHVAGEPTTAITRTLVDLGYDHTRYQIVRAMCVARDRDRFRPTDIAELIERRRGRPGTREVREALGLVDEGSNGTRGRAEDRLLAGVLQSGRLPVPHVCNRRALGIAGIEPDLAWIDVGLCVFADGRPHSWVDVRTKDALEERTLTEHGVRILRVPNRRIWRALPTVVREIELAYDASLRDVHVRGWQPR